MGMLCSLYSCKLLSISLWKRICVLADGVCVQWSVTVRFAYPSPQKVKRWRLHWDFGVAYYLNGRFRKGEFEIEQIHANSFGSVEADAFWNYWDRTSTLSIHDHDGIFCLICWQRLLSIVVEVVVFCSERLFSAAAAAEAEESTICTWWDHIKLMPCSLC